MKVIFFLALLFGASSPIVKAQQAGFVMSDKTGWHKIGMTTIDYALESDMIEVRGADKFAAIVIKVNEAPINLISFDVQFESGDNQNVVVGKTIRHPGETDIVKIEGGERRIKTIVFVYKTIAPTANKKARLEVWGLKTNPDKKKNK